MRRWTEQDIADLKLGVEIGLSHKDIANILQRTSKAVCNQASKRKFKSNAESWALKDPSTYVEELRGTEYSALEPYVLSSVKILHEHSCGYQWQATPNNILKGQGCPRCSKWAVKPEQVYVEELKETDFELLDTYTSGESKTLHRHIVCGHEWEVRPHDILEGQGCPNCGGVGFRSNKPGTTYLVHFTDLSLYKVGITNRTVQARFQSEPQPYEVIFTRYFENGEEALKLERLLLKNIKHLKVNTKLLVSGNTETFRWQN